MRRWHAGAQQTQSTKRNPASAILKPFFTVAEDHIRADEFPRRVIMTTVRPTSFQLETGWEDKPRTFSQDTLQDNWEEERIQRPEDTRYNERKIVNRGTDPDLVKVAEVTDARNLPVPVVKRHVLPGTKRVMPVHLPISKEKPYIAAAQDFTTTYQAMFVPGSLYARPVKTPTMVTQTNFSSTLSTDRTLPNKTTQGYGATLPSHPPQEHATYFETTSQEFYGRKPREAKIEMQNNPLPEKGDDARYLGGYPASANPNLPNAGPQYTNSKLFNITGCLETDFYTTESTGNETLSRGKAGSRYELGTYPEESGSLYGRSVYLDVYQKAVKPPGMATTRR